MDGVGGVGEGGGGGGDGGGIGPIPAAFAGDHVFIDDPENAGTAAAFGDMVALNLQLLHLLQPAFGAANEAERQRLAANLRNALDAARAFKDRESNTRQLQPMTPIPEADYGAVNNLANIRMNQMSQFSGDSRDPREVGRWLTKMLRSAQSFQLTLAATVNLLAHCSTGSAADFIERLQEEGRTLGEIIRSLELRYGDLVTPEEALAKANTLERRRDEPLANWIDRLRYLGRMSKRHIANAAERLEAVNLIVMDNIRRVLPDSVRREVEERAFQRARNGLPPLTCAELEKECMELEHRRADRKGQAVFAKVNSVQGHHRKGHGSQKKWINQIHSAGSSISTRSTAVNLGTDGAMSPLTESADESSDQEQDDVEVNDPGMVALVNEANYVQNKYLAHGRQLAPDKVIEKAIHRYNHKYQNGPAKAQGRGPNQRSVGKGQARQPMGAVRQAAGQVGAPMAGPPNKLNNPRLSIRDLLAKGNCTVGDCIKCGHTGHVMSSDACALRGKPLMDRACSRCNKGLHSVDVCLLTFQQPAQATAHQIQADLWTDDESDLNE